MSLRAILHHTLLKPSSVAAQLKNVICQASIPELAQRSAISTCVTLRQRGQRNRHPLDYEIEPVSKSLDVKQIQSDVLNNVQNQISSQTHGRLFAVVHLNGFQFKVTEGDMILVQTSGYFADVGERIFLEKVLAVGGSDFSLIGRPLLDNVRIEATVIEKTLSHSRASFFYLRRKNVRRMKLLQEFRTILRVNSIEVAGIDQEVD